MSRAVAYALARCVATATTTTTTTTNATLRVDRVARARARRPRSVASASAATDGGASANDRDATARDARDGDEGDEHDAFEGWAGVRAPGGRIAPEGEGEGARAALEPGLYLVGTPIGHLEDVTLRALNVLRCADAVLAEDTRRTAQLLRAYSIRTPLISYHAHNEAQRRDSLVERLLAGGALALVSDAGMPTVSDPGTDLARAASEVGVRVVPVPGPSAVLAALAGAGLPTDEFTFIGFPPPKSGARLKRLKSFARIRSTLVMFVPPHKLIGTLEDAIVAYGDRRCSVCRELTKVHEEFWRSTLSQAKEEFERRAPRGEITLVIEGAKEGVEMRDDDDDDETAGPATSSVEDALRALLASGVSPSEASRTVAKELGIRRRETYSVAQRLSEELKR